MNYVLYAFTALYAILSIFASIVQIKNTKAKISPFIMIIGGIILIAAVFLHIFSVPFNWVGVITGGLLISLAAFVNGKKGEFHAVHHIIRLVVTGLLTLGYIFF